MIGILMNFNGFVKKLGRVVESELLDATFDGKSTIRSPLDPTRAPELIRFWDPFFDRFPEKCQGF